MFYSEVSGLTAKELNKKKKELQTSMFDARMKNTLGQLPNQMVIRVARKDIARINTALTLLAKKSASGQAAPKKTAAPVAKKSKGAPKAKAAGKKVAAKKTSTAGKKG
jgi:large subunit ribosomal protein L29